MAARVNMVRFHYDTPRGNRQWRVQSGFCRGGIHCWAQLRYILSVNRKNWRWWRCGCWVSEFDGVPEARGDLVSRTRLSIHVTLLRCVRLVRLLPRGSFPRRFVLFAVVPSRGVESGRIAGSRLFIAPSGAGGIEKPDDLPNAMRLLGQVAAGERTGLWKTNGGERGTRMWFYKALYYNALRFSIISGRGIIEVPE